MKFGIEIPTCTSGMMHPVPFASAQDVADVAVEAEQLGFHDAAGNDHLSTMRFVRQAWPAPPDYFEPLITLAHVAARTSVLRLTTGIMMLPLRQPVLLAKQVATLDQLSAGRVTLGVAVGGYRDEFEAVLPDLKRASRAELTREGIEALRVLFDDSHSTYRGRYVHFEDVESFPKPVQSPLPIYSGGNVKARSSGPPGCARDGCRPSSARSSCEPAGHGSTSMPAPRAGILRASPRHCSRSCASVTLPARPEKLS